MFKISRQKKIAGIGVLAAGTLVAGVSFAAWTSNGSGSGTAQSTTSVDSVISAGTSAADLYPGAVKSVTISISNPNDYPVKVTSISAGSSGVVNTSCAAGSVTSDAVASPPATVIAGNGSGSYTIVTRMIADPDNACKSQSFTLPLTATLVSAAS